MTSKEAIETAKSMKESIEHNTIIRPSSQSVLLENGIELSINSQLNLNKPKSIIKIGEYQIYVSKTFTLSQIEHIKDYFGFDVENIEEN